jgi:Zn-dependent peptidase ImmA (M78 family)
VITHKLDIESAAGRMINRYGSRTYPIDVEKIARNLGIRVLISDMDSAVSGFLRRENGIILIGANSSHSEKRRRFTIGHELGHFDMHLNDGNEIYIDKSSTSAYFARDSESKWGVYEKEIQANAFSAALLMPEDLMRKCLEKYTPRFSSIEDIAWKMAKDFNVSEQAMTIRLINLNIFNI